MVHNCSNDITTFRPMKFLPSATSPSMITIFSMRTIALGAGACWDWQLPDLFLSDVLAVSMDVLGAGCSVLDAR